jgi:hypothetical protein
MLRHPCQQIVPFALLICLIIASQFPSASASTIPTARAEFNVLDFTSYSITWSLRVLVDGLVKSPVLAVQVRTGDVVFAYDAQYDPNLNLTTIEETLISNFTYTSGTFPREVRVLTLYFGINASVENPFGVKVMELSTQNYFGLLSLDSVHNLAPSFVQDVDPVLNRFVGVYRLLFQVQRPLEAEQYITLTMVQFPLILEGILVILTLIPVIHVMLSVYSRWKKTRARTLLNTNYFTMVIGMVFFLPIYMLSLRPLLAPIPFTQADSMLIQLTEGFATLMIASFIVSLLVRDDANSGPNATVQERTSYA